MFPKISLHQIFFFLLLFGLSVFFIRLLVPFFTDIFLALVLIMVFDKPSTWLHKKLPGKKTLTSFLTILLVIFTLIVPFWIVGYMVSNEAGVAFYHIKLHWGDIKTELTSQAIESRLKHIPYIGDMFAKIDRHFYQDKILSVVNSISSILLSTAQNLFVNLGYSLIHFFIILFLMFYMLVDGVRLLVRLRKLLPMKDIDDIAFFHKTQQVINALVINTFFIALLEASYTTILFLILGIPSPFFWGTIVIFCSIVPIVGTNAVLAPFTIILFMTGMFWKGLILAILGIGVILVNQNVIKPRLDGNKSGLHPAVVFLSSFGGILYLGLVGFLAGPIVAALCTAAWQQFGILFERQLKKGDFPDSAH